MRVSNCVLFNSNYKYSINDIVSSMQYALNDDKGNIIKDLEKRPFAVAAINGLIKYIEDTQKTKLEHINKITIYTITKYMSLDINARRNLELTEKMRDKSKKGTLLWVLDKTATSMGGRLLRRWISDPLIDVKEINNRLEAVKEFKDDIILRGELSSSLKGVYDIERLAGKISYGSANARDLNSLKSSASKLPEIKNMLANAKSGMLRKIYEDLDTLDDIFQLIDKAIVDEPPILITEGGIIKMGYSPEIDELKTAMIDGKTWLVQLEAREREELKELESKVLGAEEKVVALEYKAFSEIREHIKSQIQRLQKSAMAVSQLDVLCSFAQVAEDFNYCMPEVDDSGIVDIKDGRHPVIEKMLPSGAFVANDTYLDKESNRVSIITGPNMAGKSTYMRQVALITLMAQIGSFVPATSAHIGVVDKIFTRVGASDDLSMGQSTFMVEMMEVANILKEATANSLVVLDEIGRGTSTYDGLSIAWAVAEYIENKEKCGAKTLFATHYHELTQLEDTLEGVKNYSIAVKEKGEDIIFLRKIIPGGTDESYGVHVARLAGVPKAVTQRANEILKKIERKNVLVNKAQEKEDKKQVSGQLDLYNFKLAEIAHELDKVNVNELTPIEALNILVKIKEEIKG